MREQVAHRDPVVVGKQARQPIAHRAVQRQPELQRECRDERLRDAAVRKRASGSILPTAALCVRSPSRTTTKAPGTPPATTGSSDVASGDEWLPPQPPASSSTTASR